MKLELERVSAERDLLQQSAGAATIAAAATAAAAGGAQARTPLHPEAAPRLATIMAGRGLPQGGARGWPAPRQGRQQPPQAVLALSENPIDAEPQAASPGLVSAFAGAQPFSLDG